MVQPFREYLRPGSAVGEVARAELRKARKRDETGGESGYGRGTSARDSLMKIPAVVLRKAVLRRVDAEYGSVAAAYWKA